MSMGSDFLGFSPSRKDAKERKEKRGGWLMGEIVDGERIDQQ
jgi:hypothetical protein